MCNDWLPLLVGKGRKEKMKREKEMRVQLKLLVRGEREREREDKETRGRWFYIVGKEVGRKGYNDMTFSISNFRDRERNGPKKSWL